MAQTTRTTAEIVRQTLAMHSAIENDRITKSLRSSLRELEDRPVNPETAIRMVARLEAISAELLEDGYDVDWDIVGYFATAMSERQS